MINKIEYPEPEKLPLSRTDSSTLLEALHPKNITLTWQSSKYSVTAFLTKEYKDREDVVRVDLLKDTPVEEVLLDISEAINKLNRSEL